LECVPISLSLPTARIVGFIELLAVTSEGDPSDATLLGTLRVMAQDAEAWIGRSNATVGCRESDAVLLCNREQMVAQLEREYWRLDAQLATWSAR
jgi:hypothetical protein